MNNKDLYFVGIDTIGEIKVRIIKSKEYIISHGEHYVDGLRFHNYFENEEDANKQAEILAKGTYKDSPKYRIYKS